MIPGMFAGVNQFTDTLIAELSTNKLPKAAKKDPIRQQAGCPFYRMVLTQTPAMTKTDPKIQPILLPYLSRIQLAGNAPIGCKIVNINAFAVTTYFE